MQKWRIRKVGLKEGKQRIEGVNEKVEEEKKYEKNLTGEKEICN